MTSDDHFSQHYQDALDGSYDCIDRFVLNAYFSMAQTAGGFRTWWRSLMDNDDNLDNTHLIRFAGRFARRIRAYAEQNKIPLIESHRGERKHEIAEEYLPADPKFRGVFCIIAGRAPAPVWDIKRFDNGGMDIRRKTPQPYVCYL